MISSTQLPCGCYQSQGYGLGLISYHRCQEHYQPSDDARIIEAATNMRRLLTEYKPQQHAEGDK